MNFPPAAATVMVSAPCKVNLTLDVFAPRPDGFHPLDSIVATFWPSDTLTVETAPAMEASVRLFCDDPSLPDGDGNLAFRAARAFADRFLDDTTHAVTIHLNKRLPHQAGLGGGSSDAAAVLRALSILHPDTVTPLALVEVAAEIGSDVPLFLAGGSVRMRGRGEEIEPLTASLQPLFGVLVKPSVGVPTGPAYRLLDDLPARAPGNSTPRLLALLHSGSVSVAALGAALHNDFEAAVLPAFEEVAAAHRAVTEAGAIRALLCGSGSAIFGLARDRAHARLLGRSLRGKFSYVQTAASISGTPNTL